MILLKQSLLEQVANEFDHMFVASPRNPFTIDDPNVIVRQGRVLYAIYVPSFIERNNYDHLLRRLFLSQLAYGSSLVTILLLNLDDKIDGYGSYVMKYSFSHVSRGVDDVITYIKKGDRRNKKWEAIFEAKRWVFSKYDVNTLVTRKYYQNYIERPCELLDDDAKGLIRTQSFYSPNKQRTVREVRVLNNGFIINRRRQRNSTFRALFDSVMTQFFLRNFRYDEGYIVPSCNIIDSMPIVNTDWRMMDSFLLPNDYCKSLSFSGIIPLSIPDMDSYSHVYQDYVELQDSRNYVTRQEN